MILPIMHMYYLCALIYVNRICHDVHVSHGGPLHDVHQTHRNHAHAHLRNRHDQTHALHGDGHLQIRALRALNKNKNNIPTDSLEKKFNTIAI